MAEVHFSNKERFRDFMESFYQYGGTNDGGMHRLSLSAEDGHARDHLVAWMRSEGLKVSIDPIGNIFGVLDLAGPGAELVLSGSHLDSQPHGGRYDGAYGVVASCEALLAIRERVNREGGNARCNLGVVNWTNEEGARFQPSLLGSSVHAGLLELPYALSRRDGDDISVGEALKQIGYAGTAAGPSAAAYLELHVECADVLERAHQHFAVVTHHWGAVKYRLAFIGKQAHTGPTPMAEREDALLGAAHLIIKLRELADKASTPLHTSVGRCEVRPNSPNVVPAEAILFIELRSGSQDTLDRAEQEMLAAAGEAAARTGTRYEVRSVDRRPIGFFDRKMIETVTQEASAIGVTTVQTDTIAGHDAVAMLRICPSLVINVPSVGGVCHHPSEYTSPADLALGVEILTRTLWRLVTEA